MKNIDAVFHVRGESEYVDDLPQPAEMLFAAIYCSPIAHGKIVQCDLKMRMIYLKLQQCFQPKISLEKTR